MLEANKIGRMLLTTQQKIKLLNAVIIPAVTYILNFVLLEEAQERSLDKILTDHIKRSAKVASNTANDRLWSRTTKGGWGLLAIKHANRTTFISNIVNNALNTRTTFPRVIMEKIMEDEAVWEKKDHTRSPLAKQIH